MNAIQTTRLAIYVPVNYQLHVLASGYSLDGSLRLS
jgi:hypothetical protein